VLKRTIRKRATCILTNYMHFLVVTNNVVFD